MKFNPDITKQAIEVIFSWKRKKPNHPLLDFNGIPVARNVSTKHLGIILDEKLSFRQHISAAITKAKKGMGIMNFLAKHVNREVLNMTYKMHVRPHLEYGDVIYHNQSKEAMSLLERIQYQAGLIVSGCWQGTSKIKLYDELGWESLDERRKFHRLSCYFKIKNNLAPDYLTPLVLQSYPENGTDRYKESFFPYCFKHWDLLNIDIRESITSSGKPDLTKFLVAYKRTIRPTKSLCYNIRDRYGVSLLTRLRVDFSDLRAHRFNHNFNCPSPVCACNIENETSKHYLTCCPRFSHHRINLMNSISDIVNPETTHLPNDNLTHILLYGSNAYNVVTNKLILEASIRYIKSSKRFNVLEAYA